MELMADQNMDTTRVKLDERENFTGLFKEIREELQETAAASRPSRYA